MSRLIATAQNNILRDNHAVLNPISGLYVRSTLLEPQRTNGWTLSEDLTPSSWTKNACSVSANAIVAPDGTLTGDKIVEDGTNALHALSRFTPTLADNTLQAVSLYAVPAERAWMHVRTVDKAGVTRRSWFNVSTGAVGTKDAGHTVRVSGKHGRWRRVEIVFDSASGGSSQSVEVHASAADGGLAYQGDGASGLYVWGLQFEADGVFATSYIPTAGATATRSADQLSFPLPVALQTPQAMTAYLRWINRMSPDAAFGRWFHVGLNTGALLQFYVPSVGNVRFRHTNDAAAVSEATLATPWANGDHVEARLVLNANGSVLWGYSINGASEVTVGPSTATALSVAWSSNVIWLGTSNGTAGAAMSLLGCRCAAGVQTLATMRGL